MSGRRYSGKGSRLVKGAMGAAGGTIAGGNDVVASRRAEAYRAATGDARSSPVDVEERGQVGDAIPEGATGIQTTRPFKKPIAALRKVLIADLARSLPSVDAKTLEKAALRWMLRIAFLRYAEAHALIAPPLLTGGWQSEGFRTFRSGAAFGLLEAERARRGAADTTDGYRDLFDGMRALLAVRMPWVFDDAEAPSAMRLSDEALRAAVAAADVPMLTPFWADDYAPGWIFSWSTEGEREALDAKVNAGGKIHDLEIARKTQFFTDRYIVEWLTQNSLGHTWLCMCKKHGWTADAEAVLPILDARRAVWRAKRDAGEVTPDALMPIAEGIEEQWKYYVLQSLTADSIEKSPASIRELRLLDPAVGCGFFLFTAFDALVPLYREEARHRGETWSDTEIAKSIVENNLHGIDIDAEVTRIAAAMLWMKAAVLAPDVSISRMNLVCSDLGLHGLPADDAHVVATRAAIAADLAIEAEDVDAVMEALVEARILGSLMKLEAPIQEARDHSSARRSRATKPFALEVQ